VIEPHDRFDLWGEVRAKGPFGVIADLEREDRADVFGKFALRGPGDFRAQGPEVR
jgi:hypothetical protein